MATSVEMTRPVAPARVLRVVGGLALIAMGAVHLDQFVANNYSQIPTIGPLFALNFAGGVLVGLGLIAPMERIAGRLGTTLLALGGIAMAVASIVFLLISEHTMLFGFREAGYRPAIVIALAAEGVATLALTGSLIANPRSRHSGAHRFADGEVIRRAP